MTGATLRRAPATLGTRRPLSSFEHRLVCVQQAAGSGSRWRCERARYVFSQLLGFFSVACQRLRLQERRARRAV
jgi:hypothetical protein